MKEPIRRPVALARQYWTPVSLSILLFIIVVVVWATGDGVLARTVTDGLIRAVLVIGLYIFIGNSGVLAFGHATFMMVGAYAVAWLTMNPFKKSFALQLPEILANNQFPMLPSAVAAASFAAFIALLVGIPIMRLSGIVAAIATLAVLGMFRTYYTNWSEWTMGAATMPGIPLYVDMWVALAWTVVALFAAFLYQQSRYGLALRATREDEFAARSAGINIPRQRLIAFVLSAFFMGIGGVLEAHFLGTIAVKNYWLTITFTLLAMLIVGGQRSLSGALAGVVVITTLIEILNQLEGGIDTAIGVLSVPIGAQELTIAGIMILILVFRPAGISGGHEIPWPFGTPKKSSPIKIPVPTRAERASYTGGGIDDTLEAFDISVDFEGLVAIANVSISMKNKEIFGLIGPNGAGKTTLINVLTGFQRPTEGRVMLGGDDVTNLAPGKLGRRGLARTFQSVRLFRDLSVAENLEAAAIGTGLDRYEASTRATNILKWMDFEHKATDKADTLPYGEERRVGIGRALATTPRFVLLDEPAAGLSDAECDELMGLISQIPNEFGCGVLLIEHNMRVIMGVCQRIHVIDSGKTIAEGSPSEIQANPEVIRAYLGSKSEQTSA